MLKSKLSAWFAIWMALLTVAFYRWPHMHMLWWGAIGLSSTVGVVVGVLVHRPNRRWPWLLLAAALACFGLGDFLYNVLTDVLGLENPFPSFPDGLYLAMYPLVAAGLLQAVARRISGELCPTDTVARLGGDEFAALIEADSMADLELAAGRIVIALAEPFAVAGETVNGTSSVGLSTTVDAGSAEELMRQADLALYVAKGAGKE
ncbi:diguanylate cyclase domain-containing protein [Dactylosporangium sp. NPDC048998]|uniref:diguanylate cyclase domain-containing protein n=1 Tax=Dactylosporangium sp. NPDC048998 TaxID=3363976 RepID=UPI00371B0EDF